MKTKESRFPIHDELTAPERSLPVLKGALAGGGQLSNIVGVLDSGASRTSVPITNSAGILQVAPGSGASDLVRDETYNDDVPTEVQGTGERTFAQLVPTYEPDEDVPPRDFAALGHEAMASVLAAIERAEDPADRASVIDAYFEGVERDSRLGSYRVTDTGEFEAVR